MSGKYQQIVDAKIAELMQKHANDEESVTKELANWYQENPDILAGRTIEQWLLADRAPKWNQEGTLVVNDQTVIQIDERCAVFWKEARPEYIAGWIKRNPTESAN